MITEIQFKNYRAIEDAKLELSPLTLLIGPNGSGKTSALNALKILRNLNEIDASHVGTVGLDKPSINIDFSFTNPDTLGVGKISFQGKSPHNGWTQKRTPPSISVDVLNSFSSGIRHFAFDAAKMRGAVMVQSHTRLEPDGSNLAGFLDYIRDNGTDAFNSIKASLQTFASEYDDIGFDRPENGKKTFKLRRAGTKHFVPARDLSEGTLYVIALLALLYQPDQPIILCIEEPDRGIHPRLYRQIHDIMQQLAYPKDFGEARAPVQIIATTHSPYFLNQFSDHPEQVVVCEKGPDHRVSFRNLGKDPEARSILEDAMLGDAWATGALGGVPAQK